MDKDFKALADPTRRLLLDRLHENNGQSLGELCENVGMTRQHERQARLRPHDLHRGHPGEGVGVPDPHGDAVQLTVTHENPRDDTGRRRTAGGWSMVLSNLKTYAETGRPLPVSLWSGGHQA
ncbi:helix-turn-helix domain-containing protein [Streptomyces flavofungini]|uniref:Helix-turn-helix domain-containing protein n=1 Tax=Streptomyces flavofungini TaxID=68200 RepID=A0ABS0XAI2_9ACTN|nr:helix-turn-helix domain-containing protein [Streptomyces flavofungini]MBJ3810215.1 helix-turn-helix domain-containing protein [Streptomyces flavofungini]GHC50193.1 hypothetical protein GCM10010349_14680 [Streptomyces flavofungini]